MMGRWYRCTRCDQRVYLRWWWESWTVLWFYALEHAIRHRRERAS